jgi:hypothetical protein
MKPQGPSGTMGELGSPSLPSQLINDQPPGLLCRVLP